MIRLKKRIQKTQKSLLLVFVNRFMKHGKRDYMYNNFLLVLIRFKNRLRLTFNQILFKILNIISPVLQLKPKFVSGIIYLLPKFIKDYKSNALGLAWLVKAIKMRREYEFKYRVLFEFRDILNERGLTISYKRDYYKLSLVNRALLFKFRNK
jgi:small subunit ribosomal protein S7